MEQTTIKYDMFENNDTSARHKGNCAGIECDFDKDEKPNI